MKRIFIHLLVLIALTPLFAVAAPAESERISLFNSKDLDGWTLLKCEATVDSGDILIQSGNGLIQSKNKYADFVLEFDWKALAADKWDSGVYFRYDKVPLERPWPDRYQANLRQGMEGNVDGLEGASSKGMIKVGEWNTFKLTVKGDTVDLQINGNQAWKAKGLTGPSSGFIALQAEVPNGGQHRFKNIYLTELCAGAVEQKDTDGKDYVQLFNGKDLNDWQVKIKGYPLGENYGDTFRVEDGILKVSYDQYEKFNGRFGHLFYKTPFSNYRLRVEYRFVGEQLPDGADWAFRNSGIMIHGQSPATMKKDQDFPVSIEVQLLGGSGSGKRSTANLCTPGTNVVMGGKLHTPHCTDSTSKTYDGDQWVTVEVEVRGNTIKHIVEGETVLTYSDPQLDPTDPDAKALLDAGTPKMLTGGTISLQSESHPVEFRKVEILELKD